MKARALYSNEADSPDELSFKKGDVLIVVEPDQAEDGWWQCMLNGKSGLAPSNYLEVESSFAMDELYDELPLRQNEQPYDLLPNRGVNVDDVYDLPRKASSDDDYDVLPSKRDDDEADGVYDLPRNVNNNNMRRISEEDDDYDLPRPFLSPKTMNPVAEDEEDEAYDELPQRKKNVMRNSVASSTASSDSVSISSLQIDAAPLAIDNECAVEKLLKLKADVDSTVSRILSLFTHNWRTFAEKPPSDSERVKVGEYTRDMLQALREFIDFGRATLATVLAVNVICKKTTSIITRRLQPIEEDAKILEDTEQRLASGNWVSGSHTM